MTPVLCLRFAGHKNPERNAIVDFQKNDLNRLARACPADIGKINDINNFQGLEGV